MTQDYSNKNILLTGAASGIGFSQLEAYLAAGAIGLCCRQARHCLSTH